MDIAHPIEPGPDIDIVYSTDDARLIPWAADRIGLARFRDDARAIGLLRHGRIAAVAVYDTWAPCDCCVHLASDGSRRWLNRAFLISGFAYPFITAGLPRITGLVPASNADALRFDLHIGWKVEGRCREAMPNGDDIIVLGMLRRECRYLPRENRP